MIGQNLFLMANIRKQWLNPVVTGSYSGARAFARAKNLDYKTVVKELSNLKAYTLFKPARKPKYRPIVSHFMGYQVSFDLVILDQYSKYNQGYKYVLVVVDSFTKKLYTEPLRKKTAEASIVAFKKILKRMKRVPRSVFQHFLFKFEGLMTKMFYV